MRIDGRRGHEPLSDRHPRAVHAATIAASRLATVDHRRRSRESREEPEAGSVEILDVGRSALLEAELSLILGRMRPNTRTIVVDDGSTDGLALAAAALGPVPTSRRRPRRGAPTPMRDGDTFGLALAVPALEPDRRFVRIVRGTSTRVGQRVQG